MYSAIMSYYYIACNSNYPIVRNNNYHLPFHNGRHILKYMQAFLYTLLHSIIRILNSASRFVFSRSVFSQHVLKLKVIYCGRDNAIKYV